MEESTSVTNFTRTFTDIYTTCLECQDANPCPLNLSISSCCVTGTEYVTGSLPGLNVGDTFVDNYGLCWTVDSETGAPISEESIIIDHIIPTGNCATCLEENECPNFYQVAACCTSTSGIIAIPAITIINVGNSFVDTNGICWEVIEEAISLPTIYGIVVDTVYTGAVDPDTNCDLCIAANPCPTEYFITIKSCCDPDRIEVAQVPADFMIFTEGTIFQDDWGICWEVISFNTTGVETYPIFDWFGIEKPLINTYRDCRECLDTSLPMPCGFYEVRECGSETTTIAGLTFAPTIGLVYLLADGDLTTCYEIIGYGYPIFGELYPSFDNVGGPFTNCEDCNLANKTTTKTLEFSQCCGGPNIIVEYTDAWTAGFGGIAMIPLSEIPEGPYALTCVTLVGFSTATPTLYNQQDATANYGSCIECIDKYGCS
jgi:hypothetical protein